MNNIPFIYFICCILSRLAYFKNNKFLNKYNNIFYNNIIPNNLLVNISKVKIDNIFNNKISDTNIKIYSKKINKINNNLRKDIVVKNNNVKYISISTSNYSSIYIIADKTMNSIFITFRGTSSPKSMTSYFKLSSIKPFPICNDSKAGFNLGIYKITCEVIHTIMESILYLAKDFLYYQKNSIKIFSTGHSLGIMSLIFSYNYIGMRNNKKSIYSKDPYNILDNKICCITFGAPRVMNIYAKKIFNKLIKNKFIYFKRIVVLNDIFTELPITTRLFSSSYYHPNETKINNKNNEKVDYRIFYDSKGDLEYYTKKYSLTSHGIYLHLTFNIKSLANPFKEVERYKGSTVCRIILGGDNLNSKAVFFILDDAKNIYSKKKDFLPPIEYQDINITKKAFDNLLDNMHEINNMNPLKGPIIEIFKNNIKKKNINCLTANLILI